VEIDANIAATVGRGIAGRVPRASLSVVVALTLAAVLLAPAYATAAEPTSGYTVPTKTEPTSGYTVPATEPPKNEAPKSEPPKPPPSSPQTHTSSSGSSPSKESEKPLVEEAHGGVLPENERLAGEAPAKAGALPFTGLDLRWELGFGVLLMVTGLALVAAQRRRERVRRR
jgi:hypothetical protein